LNEQGASVHIKATMPNGDPVELSDDEVQRLICFFQAYLDSQTR